MLFFDGNGFRVLRAFRRNLLDVDRLLGLRGAPFFDERWIGHEFDAGAEFGFGEAGAGRIAHGLEDGAVVAVVVGRAEQAPGHAATRDGRVFALRRLDVDRPFLEAFGEVDGQLVREEFFWRAGEPAARGALVEPRVLVFFVELDAHEGGVRVLEEEGHQFAQRHRAAALLHLARDEAERLVFGEKPDAEGRGFARRAFPAEGPVSSERRSVPPERRPVSAERRAAFAERRALPGFRARPETAGAVFARRAVAAEGRTVPARRPVAERRPVAARRAVAPEAAAVAAFVPVVAAGEAFRVFSEVCGVRGRILFRPVRGEAEFRQEVVLVVGIAVVHGGLRSAGFVRRGGKNAVHCSGFRGKMQGFRAAAPSGRRGDAA